MRAHGTGVLVYDFLFCRGGAEYLTLVLAEGISKTDIVVAFRDSDAFPDSEMAGVRCCELGPPPGVSFRAWRTLSGLYRFRRRAGFLADYDWVIFSGSTALEGVWHRPPGRNLYYCHTLPRFAYDLYEYYLAQISWWQRPVFRALVWWVRRRYEAALGRMDVILANSQNVRGRLKRYLGLDATVVNPPCDTTGYRWLADEGYFLSPARLEPFKRVDKIIEAFRQMPDQRLVVASGGADEARLRQIAGGCANIEFTGWQSDAGMRELVGRARATIYVAQDEDFGMSPVESMAAGKPVIGVAEGGLLETVIHGKTGILVNAPAPEVIAAAVRGLSAERAAQMRPACEARASGFGTEKFLAAMQAAIASTRSADANNTCL
ncbi:glycosyltransferase involved in cell wall biosynthesis [Desulfosalsimonas propionicica]|uniref:Glycosyltransferase involved in cell wall biosynthesis n=1 Tax=Desulfosalsimonas propionicica TaxID=332175 RepID=A0A7W0C6N2_9BACT|nr:glycosyltransferase [Desulfosalsimonas propionicica]MBA2880015.1 glycosyltransferase involved in cell wall biosynthesis [Desulfosalsimonas propionicica]